MSDTGIQHKQTFVASTDFGFDDEGLRVAVAMPEEETVEQEATSKDLQAALRGFVELLTTDATPLQTGQRIHLLAYLMGVSGFKTKAEFATKLKVSPGRVSQIIRDLPIQLRTFAHLKSRAAKARDLGRKVNSKI